MSKILLLILIIIPLCVLSTPHHGTLMNFEQPDGEFVTVKLFGDEYYMRAESPDGYTLVRDDSGWICYAKLSTDKTRLLSTGIRYTDREITTVDHTEKATLSRHLDISPEARRSIQEKNRQAMGIMPGSEKKGTRDVVGNYKGLCIVVDFADEPGFLDISEFEDFCNGDNYTGHGNNGSLKGYYYDISGGLVIYENYVFGYFRAPKTFAEYDAMDYAQGAHEILGLTLNWINDQGFDFSTLTTNNNDRILAINLMYTGNPPTWAEGMWYHAGYYDGFSADGVSTGRYNTSPANSPLRIGTVCHENGHMLCGWPDTYKYDNSGDGIGSFDLMCSTGSGANPVPPNPYFWSRVGWGQVIDVTDYNGYVLDTANTLKVCRYNNTQDTDEFYLIKSRMKTGRSEKIPDEGLTIWHIDEEGDNQTDHHMVFLEHASNNTGIHQYACWKESFSTEFNDTTLPSAQWYNNINSGLKVWGIGPAETVMHYNIGDPVMPIADFYALTTSTCSGLIMFKNLSLGGETYLWDFGSGNTSVEKNPVHVYETDGIYTVELTVTNSVGSDILSYTDYIEVSLVYDVPETTGDIACAGDMVILTASGNNVLRWFDAEQGGHLVNTGPIYLTDELDTTTIFYVESAIENTEYNIGPADNTIGNGSYYSTDPYGLYFDVIIPVEIRSVKVYAEAGCYRTVQILDTLNGNVVDSFYVYIPAGESRVDLNISLEPADHYFIKLKGNAGLYRNKAGADYPYEINDMIAITGCNMGGSISEYYYYFYDWEVSEQACAGEQVPVTATILEAPDKPEIMQSGNELYTNPGYQSYQWYFDGEVISGGVSNVLEVTLLGLYAVEVTNNIGCAAMSDTYSFVTINDPELSVHINVYPNPGTGRFTVAFYSRHKIYQIKVFNIFGQMILARSGDRPPGDHHEILDLRDCAPGIYKLMIIDGNKVYSKNLVIE